MIKPTNGNGSLHHLNATVEFLRAKAAAINALADDLIKMLTAELPTNPSVPSVEHLPRVSEPKAPRKSPRSAVDVMTKAADLLSGPFSSLDLRAKMREIQPDASCQNITAFLARRERQGKLQSFSTDSGTTLYRHCGKVAVGA